MQHFLSQPKKKKLQIPVKIQRNAPDAVLSKFSVLSRKGQTEQALELLRKARNSFPSDIRIDILIAETEFMRGSFVEAIEAYQTVLRHDPNNHQVFTNIGVALEALGRHSDAASMFATALKIAPQFTEARARKARLDLRRCDWTSFDDSDEAVQAFKSMKVTFTPGSFLALADDPALQKKVCESYVAKNYTIPKVKRPKVRTRKPGEKIKIGYFSSDFHRHATMHLMIHMLELHDRERFEIHLFDYTTTEQVQPWKDRILATACHYHRVVDLADDQVAALARAQAIDIAIDLKGHTLNGRPQILLHQPAPVLMSYLGHPGTLGFKGIDYIVADPVVIPEPARKHYSEKILYMPDCYQVADSTRDISERTPSRRDLGLPDDAVVLCCFNSHYKITPKEFDIWMRVMGQVQNTVLWLWCRDEEARENLLREADARGVSRDRIIFAQSLQQEEHLARIQAADLFLDTFAVCAHTTASDAMWAGLPLVTLEGQQFAARVASSILHAMDLPELVTRTPQDYEALILDLAQNPEKLLAVREKLAMNRKSSAMFDTARFTRNWEKQLENALHRCERGLKPDHLMLS